MENKEELLTAAEAAALLRITPAVIKRYCREKVLAGCFRVSNKWRIPRAAIKAFIEAGGHVSQMGRKKTFKKI